MLVAFAGPMQSGKTTAANWLAQHYGFTRVSFADPIKEAALALDPTVALGVTLREAVDLMGWQEAKLYYPEARRILQALGTEVGRDLFGESFWIDMAMRQCGLGNFAFDDCRFDNEADRVRAVGGLVVEIRRPGCEYSDSHASEAGLTFAPDATILGFDVPDLENQLAYLLRTDIFLDRGLEVVA